MTFRCSELDRVLECNGSITLVPMVDPRDGDEGNEGSALHFISAERMVRELGAAPPENGLGDYAPTWPVIKFSRWISDYYVRHVRENVPADWSLEVEAALSYEFEGFTLSGHIDCVAISPDGTEAIGWDLKTGYDPVDEAEQNWQMLGYIVLLKRAYPKLRKVTFYVVQPRNDEDEGFQRVSRVSLNDDLDFATAGLVGKLLAAMGNRHELNSGRKQCKWCSAAPQCPALKAERERMKMTLTPAMLAQIKKTPDDATLAEWVIAAKTLARPIEDAENLAKDRIAAAGQIVAPDGTAISMKTQRGSYKVTDPLALWKTLTELLPENRRAVCAKWSMSQVKDQISEELKVPKTGSSAITSETVFDAKVRPHVEQGERKIFQFS